MATCCADPERLAPPIERAGCRMLALPKREGHVDLDALMARLGQEEVDSVLLEGGGTLNWAALRSGVVQKVFTYLAPKLLGGRRPRLRWRARGSRPGGGASLRKTPRAAHPAGGRTFLLESEVDPLMFTGIIGGDGHRGAGASGDALRRTVHPGKGCS